MNAADFSQWMTIVGNAGFPVAISLYLLCRLDKKIDHMQEVITQLSETMKDNR
ncbi:YvrJ family protein [Bacillus ginsengihumi]|uniref:YvrJ family protein n=1 Tax=Heyndrickxia ginsengihumi TaxID=363870 RepID=A0A6M0PBM0_9BACI|nr:YvrJ family protein [Heyndrickxia ginsengihumi]NEY21489.1 YvrJ family protein [Heyndrickxia ginsengihumi]